MVYRSDSIPSSRHLMHTLGLLTIGAGVCPSMDEEGYEGKPRVTFARLHACTQLDEMRERSSASAPSPEPLESAGSGKIDLLVALSRRARILTGNPPGTIRSDQFVRVPASSHSVEIQKSLFFCCCRIG